MSEEDLQESNSNGLVQSLVKGLRILGLFSHQSPSYSVGEIIQASGYPRATAYRLVRTLESERYLILNPATNRYQIGPAMSPALYSLKDPSSLLMTLRDDLQSLADEVDGHASLAIEVDDAPMVIDSASGSFNPFQLDMGAGRIDSATSTSHGKIFIAHKTPEQLVALLKRPLARRTEKTITDPEALAAELKRVRQDGVAFDMGEHWAALCGASAPVWDGTGSLAAAVSCVTTVERFTSERRQVMAEAVKACAARMSHRLGYANSSGEWPHA